MIIGPALDFVVDYMKKAEERVDRGKKPTFLEKIVLRQGKTIQMLGELKQDSVNAYLVWKITRNYDNHNNDNGEK